jgi:hypothetical protein
MEQIHQDGCVEITDLDQTDPIGVGVKAGRLDVESQRDLSVDQGSDCGSGLCSVADKFER